jgi:hypothetical protein
MQDANHANLCSTTRSWPLISFDDRDAEPPSGRGIPFPIPWSPQLVRKRVTYPPFRSSNNASSNVPLPVQNLSQPFPAATPVHRVPNCRLVIKVPRTRENGARIRHSQRQAAPASGRVVRLAAQRLLVRVGSIPGHRRRDDQETHGESFRDHCPGLQRERGGYCQAASPACLCGFYIMLSTQRGKRLPE